MIHPSSVAVSREHRRAKTDRLDTALLKRGFLGWLRGERGHCSMARVPTIAEEDAKRPGLPRRNRRFREPHGQAPALAQRDVIGSPIRYSVPLLRDVMPAILVRFEWHDDDPRSKTGSQIYRPLLPANDRSVQQGGTGGVFQTMPRHGAEFNDRRERHAIGQASPIASRMQYRSMRASCDGLSGTGKSMRAKVSLCTKSTDCCR